MKKIVMALVCSCVAFSSFSQIADLASNHVQQPTPLENKYVQPVGIVSPLVNQTTTNRIPLAPGLRMRKVGQTMTVIGGILFVGGIVVVSQADANTYSYQSNNGYTQEEGDPKFALGVVMITHGIGLTVPGIILWNKGAKKFNRWTEEQRQQHISLGIQRSGLGLHYRF
jgi:hypothetical protein